MAVGDVRIRQLYQRYVDNDLPQHEAKMLVPRTWSQSEYPFPVLGADRWGKLWDHIGYTRNGMSAARPVNTLTLFRGSDGRNRYGWGWTPDWHFAYQFAGTGPHDRPGCVWEAHVEPWRLKAYMDFRNGIEREYVVMTEGLVVVAHADQGPGDHSCVV